jgi:DedD protein
MALFKFRFPGQKANSDAKVGTGPTDSVEALRQRAKHRLIGAVVLVAIGVVGFPLLFDTQPRPVAVDIPIDIPDKAKTKPLAIPASSATTPGNGRVAASASLAPREQVISEKNEPKQPKALVKPEVAAIKKEAASAPRVAPPEPKVEARAKPDEAARADEAARTRAAEAARARALLEGADKAPADSRFVVQIGAFADQTKARETRLRLEAAGLKTYTHVAETPEGRRIRVRVGPYPTRAEADKAAKKIKSLNLPAAILTL